MISVDRSNKSEMVKLLKRSKEVLNEGRVIAIFPEGTRRKGDKFLPFKIGTKILAEKLNVKIQPVVIVGSKEIIDEHKKEARGGEVKLIFLDSFYPKDAKSSWYEDLKDKMERVYFENLNKRS
jgi:1-acyl-sn-glycerol-3-phosphate acyltransferase